MPRHGIDGERCGRRFLWRCWFCVGRDRFRQCDGLSRDRGATGRSPADRRTCRRPGVCSAPAGKRRAGPRVRRRRRRAGSGGCDGHCDRRRWPDSGRRRRRPRGDGHASAGDRPARSVVWQLRRDDDRPAVRFCGIHIDSRPFGAGGRQRDRRGRTLRVRSRRGRSRFACWATQAETVRACSASSSRIFRPRRKAKSS